MLRSVCVFCGSSPGVRGAYAEAARQLGSVLGREDVRLVYGGASVGLMGVVADAARAAGGEVVGVIPHALVDREVAHDSLDTLEVVGTMHERKARMAELAEAFIALPGGLGTLEELFEIWTWGLLGLHSKPFGLMDVESYYAPLVRFLDHAVAEGFVRERHRSMLIVDRDAEALVSRLSRLHPAPGQRVITEAER
jgi:uncharacterized protein (TIGR00730 family)